MTSAQASCSGNGARIAAHRLWALVCLVGFVILATFSITNSSLSLLDDPADGAQGLLLGRPQAIRSDEWIRFTPMQIGTLTEPAQDLSSALALSGAEPDSWPGVVTDAALFLDARFGRLLAAVSPTIAFAFTWWFPVFLYFLCFPLWLRRLGVSLGAGILVAGIIYFSPPNQWWSLHPVQILGWTALAAYGAVAASDRWAIGTPRSRVVSGLLVAVSGIALGRLAVSYLVWVIPLAPVLLLPTVAWLMAQRGSRARSAIICTSAALVGLALAAIHWFGSSQFKTLSATVYPGMRETAGAALPYQLLFGGIFDGYLQSPTAVLQGSNLSELAGGYALLGLAGLVTWTRVWPRLDGTDKPKLLVLVGWASICYSWAMLAWPASATGVPLLNRIPAERMNQVAWVGVVVILALMLAHQPPDRASLRTGDWFFLPPFFLAAGLAGSLLKASYLPALPTSMVWAISAAWALAMAFLVSMQRPVLRWLPIAVLAILSTAAVNPIQHGFADLQDSRAARSLRDLDSSIPPEQFLAADDLWASALLAANAVETLSGQQTTGPDRADWAVLDPEGRYADQWNRGASTVLFSWQDAGAQTSIAAPVPDTVMINIDPCNEAARGLGLGGLSSSRELTNSPCLIPVAEASIAGTPRWLYRVDTGDGQP